MDDILGTALNQLDEALTAKKLNIEIVICGAYALHLFGYQRTEHTLDIDSISELQSAEIIKIIADIGKKLNLGERWLNDQASTVSLPNGIFARTVPIQRWQSIKASLVSRIDLIKMKASAFLIRRDHTNKDWEDLILLKPTKSEIEQAIHFIYEFNSPAIIFSKKVQIEFEETLNDLRKIPE